MKKYKTREKRQVYILNVRKLILYKNKCKNQRNIKYPKYDRFYTNIKSERFL